MSLFCPDCRSTFADETLRVCPNDGTRLYMLDSRDGEDPLIGATIDGRFHIERSIGVGGMGTVYRARQLSVGRDVAVKVLRAELSGKEVALERFFREAKTISQLTHPNIVRLIDFGQDREFDILFLVMELVDGANLGDLLRQGRLRVSLALEIAYQVCGALTEPHAAGVIHRDLKPDNLLLCPVSDGTLQAKVLDFGIARALESKETTLTATGMICGTPAYMAPEQAQNEKLTPQTDLYALGVILYEMLSGWPPFSGTSSLQIMLKHIQEVPVALRELLPPATLPQELETLVYDLMNKDRTKRPISARDVRDSIDELRGEFDFGHVRVDDLAELDDFVLRKLPRAETSASGPTEVLRRETGMEKILTAHRTDSVDVIPDGIERDTIDEMDHHTTFPFTPDEKGEVRADARVKVSTREGAQQAWTPGDQPSLGLKNTEKSHAQGEVDPYDATAASPTPESLLPGKAGGSKSRKTLVEEPPRTTDEDAPAVVEEKEKRRTPTTDERTPADTSTSLKPASDNGSTMPLVIALVMTLFVAAAAFVVIEELRSLNDNSDTANPTSTAAPPETTAVALPPGAREGAIERGAAYGVLVGTHAQSVSEGVEEAQKAAKTARAAGHGTPKSDTKPRPNRDPKPAKVTAEEPPREKKPASGQDDLDELIRKKLKDDTMQ